MFIVVAAATLITSPWNDVPQEGAEKAPPVEQHAQLDWEKCFGEEPR